MKSSFQPSTLMSPKIKTLHTENRPWRFWGPRPGPALSLAFALLLASPLYARQETVQHVIVRKPPEGRGLMAPNNGGIWSWGDEILVMYVNGPHKNGTGCGSHSTQEGAPGATYDTSRSLDGGVTWGDHRVAFKRHVKSTGWPDPQPVALTTPLDFSDPDTIVHFQRNDEGLTYFYVSTDKGKNWTGPYNNIPKFKQGIHGRTNYEVTGKRSMTAYMELAEDPGAAATRRFPSYAVETTDGGITWTLGSMISATEVAAGKKFEWDTHPSVARIDANTLIASFRSGNQTDKTWTRTGWFDVTRSTDNGKTWSHLIRLGESPGNNSCPTSTQVVPLPDGRKRVVTLMWLRPPDKQSCEKSKLLARFSDDKGDTWSDPIILRDDVFGWDSGYPIATVRADGKIVVCYWMKTMNQDEPNYIGATIWDAASGTANPPAASSAGTTSAEKAAASPTPPESGAFLKVSVADGWNAARYEDKDGKKIAIPIVKSLNLTQEGTLDWFQPSGDSKAYFAIRKNIATPQIEEPTFIPNKHSGKTNVGWGVSNSPVAVSANWTDGKPLASGSDYSGYWAFQDHPQGRHYAPGAVWMVKASAIRERILSLYLRRWNNDAKVKLSLSDNSAPAVVWQASDAWFKCEKLAVRFRAASAEAKLKVEFMVGDKKGTMNKDYWVWLHALTLQESGDSVSPSSATATPPPPAVTASAAAGQSATLSAGRLVGHWGERDARWQDGAVDVPDLLDPAQGNTDKDDGVFVDRKPTSAETAAPSQPPARWTTNAWVGQTALEFRGQSYVQVTPSANLAGSSLGNLGEALTVAAWVRFDSTPEPTGWNQIANIFSTWYLERHGDPGMTSTRYPGFWVQLPGFEGEKGFRNVRGKTSLNDGYWHHVAATYSSAKRVQAIYVDGELENSATVSGKLKLKADETLNIGSRFKNAGGAWNGAIDDVRVYDYDLAPEQIKALALLGRNVSPKIKRLSLPGGSSFVPRLNEPMALEATVTDLNDDSLTFQWSAEPADGVNFSPDANTQSPRVSFSKPGGYVLTLRVDDGKVGFRHPELKVDVAATLPVIVGLAHSDPVDISRQANRARSGPQGWFGLRNGLWLPPGTYRVGGVDFTLPDEKANAGKGVIALGCAQWSLPLQKHQTDAVLKFPAESAPIPVGKKADALFFLHTAAFAHEEPAGTVAWEYEVRYAGEGAPKAMVPVRLLVDVADSTYKADRQPPVRGQTLGVTEEYLYVQRWDNPHPDRVIESIVARSRLTKAAGILVAVSTGHKTSRPAGRTE